MLNVINNDSVSCAPAGTCRHYGSLPWPSAIDDTRSLSGDIVRKLVALSMMPGLVVMLYIGNAITHVLTHPTVAAAIHQAGLHIWY
jgi:hypothetical protein